MWRKVKRVGRKAAGKARVLRKEVMEEETGDSRMRKERRMQGTPGEGGGGEESYMKERTIIGQ